MVFRFLRAFRCVSGSKISSVCLTLGPLHYADPFDHYAGKGSSFVVTLVLPQAPRQITDTRTSSCEG